MKILNSKHLISITLILSGLGFGAVYATVNYNEFFPNSTTLSQSKNTGWASPVSSSKEIIIPDGTCRKITSTIGTQYYIPTYSQEDWNRFVANTPSGITIGYCTPTATLTASPLSVVYGNGTNLTWSSTNTDYCERTGVNPVPYGTWPSGAIATGGTIYTNPLINSPTTFYLRCHGLDGTYATANVTVSINPIIGECNNAVMLGCKSGQTAFNDNRQVSCNTTRTWQCRGQFSGSDSPQCSKANAACASCSSPWGGAAIAHGSSVTAYASSSVACGSTCSSISEVRTCNNGTLGGSYTRSSCNVDSCTASCNLPWGGTLAHMGHVMTYASSSVACGNTCSSIAEVRTCINGTLNGSYTNRNCSIEACCTVTSCNASTPACGTTTSGTDNCGGSCTKTGGACACTVTSCNASTPACGTTTSGTDNCGGSCTKTGGACPVCSSSTWYCNTGTASNGNGATSCNTTSEWDCSNGGTTIRCSKANSACVQSCSGTTLCGTYPSCSAPDCAGTCGGSAIDYNGAAVGCGTAPVSCPAQTIFFGRNTYCGGDWQNTISNNWLSAPLSTHGTIISENKTCCQRAAAGGGGGGGCLSSTSVTVSAKCDNGSWKLQ